MIGNDVPIIELRTVKFAESVATFFLFFNVWEISGRIELKTIINKLAKIALSTLIAQYHIAVGQYNTVLYRGAVTGGTHGGR
ncbi:unnamed protein product [marine sediment metagenome]|uniref:Uncharacterized protein n=1 Tax=marine sediment metagenome TaxID=412755 RepID=X1A7S0_9ZZZZ